MMNGEAPGVPITTLSGIASLTDLLAELPLPSPVPSMLNKSLFNSPELAEEAQRLIGRQDENLIPQLIQALSQTSTEHIELKDKSLDGELDNSVPPLLQAILARDPNIFRPRRGDVRSNSPRQPMAPSPHFQQQQASSGYHRSHLNVHSNSSSPSMGATSPGRFPQGSPARAQGSPRPVQRSGGIPSHGSPVPVNGIPNMQGSASPSVPPQGAHIPSSPRAAASSVSAGGDGGLSPPQSTVVPMASTSTGKRGRPRKKHVAEENNESSRHKDSSEADSRKQSPSGADVGAGDTSESGRSERHSKKRKKSKSHKEDREKDSDKSNVKYVISSPTHSTKITIKLRRPPEEDPKHEKSKQDQTSETPEKDPKRTKDKGKNDSNDVSEEAPLIPAIKIRLSRDPDSSNKEKSPEKLPEPVAQKSTEPAGEKTTDKHLNKEHTKLQEKVTTGSLPIAPDKVKKAATETTADKASTVTKEVTTAAIAEKVADGTAEKRLKEPPTKSLTMTPENKVLQKQPVKDSSEKAPDSKSESEKAVDGTAGKAADGTAGKAVDSTAGKAADGIAGKTAEAVSVEASGSTVGKSSDEPSSKEAAEKGDKNSPSKDVILGEKSPIETSSANLLVTSPRIVLNKIKLPDDHQEPQDASVLDESLSGRKRKRVNYKESESSNSPKDKEQPDRFVDYGLNDPEPQSLTEEPRTPSPPPPIFIDRVEPEEQEKEEPKKKKARIEEKVKVTLEDADLQDSSMFRRFNAALETVLESSEAMDVSVDDTDDDDDNDECSPDLLINKPLLKDLVSEAAKLKSMGATNQLPKDKLVHLLNILERNIRDGTRLQPHNCQSESKREQRHWKEEAMERITHSVDSALTAIHIMTSESMPKEVFIEDVIDRIAQLIKYQLQYSIYPEFDPVYRINRDAKGDDVIITNMKLKRARGGATKERITISLYNKLCELVSNMAELMSVQALTDSTVLLISSLGTAPFFVENVSELQLCALKLISTVFSQYEKHRQLILEDIFASLARLPSSKKNLRNFKLNVDQSIQMVTALVLQLIQCVVVLPSSSTEEEEKKKSPEEEYDDIDEDEEEVKEEPPIDKGVLVVNAYETAIRTGQNFLSVFLKKCVSKDEEDYRPLFENFVQDLLSAVNKPEWPAAELLLSLLGRLLMHHFSNKSNDMTMRVSSLEYLGQIASRLRKDAVSSRMDQDVLDTISQEIISSGSGREKGSNEKPGRGSKKREPENTDYLLSLQRAMLDYFMYNSQDDPALMFARQFYVAQWYRDTSAEMENTMKKREKEKEDGDDEDEQEEEEEKEEEAEEEESSEESEEEEDSSDDDSPRRGRRSRRPVKQKKRKEDKKKSAKKTAKEKKSPRGESGSDENSEILEKGEKRKEYLLTVLKLKVASGTGLRKTQNIMTYESASLVARYLASKRPFSQSFDIYLSQILRVLSETAVAIRTRAMKCLSSVVAADTNILARTDVQKAVYGRFIDQSTSVREAAVELVGRFVLMEHSLTNQYYDMLMERILDTGISVRKRVIKTLRDICIEQPNFDKIPEVCVKIIRRVNDEEGIKKLVNETFQKMWFTPLPVSDRKLLLKRALNVIEVVAASKDTGYDWLEQLLANLLKSEEGTSSKPVQKACVQISDCLVEYVLRLETLAAESTEEGAASSRRLVACLQTLFLFSKVKPELMVTHATTLQPYLSTKCSTQGDFMVVYNTARILELVVPLMDHPSEVFLATLEEDMMKLIIKHGQLVLQSCVSCLGAIVNKVTRNHRLVRDCFQKYYGVLSKYQKEHERDVTNPTLITNKPTLRRALFTVGLFCKHFDFDAGIKNSKLLVSERVLDVLHYFCNHEDEDIRLKALNGLGFLCNRYADFLLTAKVKDLYYQILENPDDSIPLLTVVLRNVQLYLTEEDEKMRKADEEWRKVANKEDLKEMGDVQSGMSSSVMQLYLKLIMRVMLHPLPSVRLDALKVVILTLKQGLVHPVQCVPYLIAMGADMDTAIRVKADQQLSEIDTRYPGFLQMKSLAGVKMAFELQKMLMSKEDGPVRGVREREASTISLCSHVYSLIRSNRSHRRAFLTSLLNLYDETSKADMNLLVFVADNISSFSFQVMDEPLFIMHHIEIIVSVSGANLLQSFKESFKAKQSSRPPSRSSRTKDSRLDLDSDDDEEDADDLLARIPEDPTQLIGFCMASQACIVLLVLKQHLKDLYGFRDNTIQRYSPTEVAKIYDKPLHRKHDVNFNPARALEIIQAGQPELPLSEQYKKDLVAEYLDFKQLMELMDPADSDEEEEDKADKKLEVKPAERPPAETNGGDKVEHKKEKDGSDSEVEVKEKVVKKEVTPKRKPPPKKFVAEIGVAFRKEPRSRGTKQEVKYKEDSDEDEEQVAAADEDDDSDSDSSAASTTETPSSRGGSRKSTSAKTKARGRVSTKVKPTPKSNKKRRKKHIVRDDSSDDISASDDSEYVV